MKKLAVAFILMFSSILAESPAPATAPKRAAQNLDLQKVFTSSPLIYSLLLLMSSSSAALWLYTIATLRPKKTLPKPFLDALKRQIEEKKYTEASALCEGSSTLLASMIRAGLENRSHGAQVMIDAMKSEGKRASANFWQRLSLLNDIAIVAPMLGLLGTVIGMFYAFYDVNRSIESINSLFDGLGIAIGTTVAGLVVAILSMILATTLKYRLVKNLGMIENSALSLSSRIAVKE